MVLVAGKRTPLVLWASKLQQKFLVQLRCPPRCAHRTVLWIRNMRPDQALSLVRVLWWQRMVRTGATSPGQSFQFQYHVRPGLRTLPGPRRRALGRISGQLWRAVAVLLFRIWQYHAVISRRGLLWALPGLARGFGVPIRVNLRRHLKADPPQCI